MTSLPAGKDDPHQAEKELVLQQQYLIYYRRVRSLLKGGYRGDK